jgi:hypothetical protein
MQQRQTIRLVLGEAERAAILRPINGRGGFQCLLKALRSTLVGDTLCITPALSSRILRYVTRYGGGGFQSRLCRVAGAAAGCSGQPALRTVRLRGGKKNGKTA